MFFHSLVHIDNYKITKVNQIKIKIKFKRGDFLEVSDSHKFMALHWYLFSVKKVSMFSPSAKAGLAVGDTLVTINDWNIEAMDNIQVRRIIVKPES